MHNRNESNVILRLYGEIIDSFSGKSNSIKQKMEIYKIARENKAFIFMFKKRK
jgi:ribosomal protein S7